MNRAIIAFVLILALTLTGVYYHYESKLTNAKEEILMLEENEEIIRLEILELEEKNEKNNKKIKENEKLILDLNLEVEKLNEKEKLKDVKITDLEDEIEKLEGELSKYDHLRQLNVVATAYTSECKGCIGITKTGHNVKNTVYRDGKRVVATDPSIIPLNSIIHVESKGMSFMGVASDIGGAIKGSRIDILVDSKSRAYKYGKQEAKITILKEGEEAN